MIPNLNLSEESEKITTFIRSAFERAHKQTAVIALSGGIDSATSLFLTAKALGPDHIEAFHLPSKHSQPVHLTDARAASDAAGLTPDHFHIINIGAIIQKSWRIIQRYGKYESMEGMESSENTFYTSHPSIPSIPQDNRLRLANLAARIRMLVIYDQAKKFDALVIGTENYSEHCLGYFTRFGDEASDLEPIRHLYKTQVIDLAQSLGIPEAIITKPPSADLWPGQTDASELGFTYAEADPILYLLDQGKTVEEIIHEGFETKLVEAVTSQVKISAFKHQVPYHI